MLPAGKQGKQRERTADEPVQLPGQGNHLTWAFVGVENIVLWISAWKDWLSDAGTSISSSARDWSLPSPRAGPTRTSARSA